MSRRVRAALVGATLVALLAACAAPLPEPEPDPVPAVPPPALSVARADEILADLGATLAEADAAASPEALQPRVTDPAATIRASQYVRATAGDTTAVTVIPEDWQTLVVPTTDTWPRTVMVVTAAPDDLQAPLLLTLVQDTPRAQFRMSAWARLFPGVQMPATAEPELGSAPLPGDSDALAVAPEDVLAQYVDVLTSREDSAYTDAFAPDPLSTAIAAQADGWSAAVAGRGTLTQTYQVIDGPWSLATAEGGGLVVGAIQTVTALTLVDSTLTIGDLTASLLGTSTVSSDLTITWLSVVVFDVPPAGSSDPIEVLGAEHAPVQVTGS
ncbi:MAG TPA: hypothetical protein VN257_01230 [Actinotalea sp.]|nr:hypothetical protein [Actinotalea sp.]